MAEMKANNQENTKPPEEFKALLAKAVSDFHLPALSEEQLNRLAGHYAMMIEWNRHTNLTRITRPEEAARLHYAEALFGAPFLKGARKVLDIGSGAGFPAFPLAVACPQVEITALESNQKKSLFLMEAQDALQISNIKIARARLEDFDTSSFDLLTSRALDRAEEVMPQVLKKLTAQQRLMLYCAPDLVAHLEQKLEAKVQIETRPIPLAASRLIALFSRP
jgi:16S rRNA (guanine(527)-N(7))-methyltransferase RsmG